MVAADIGRWLNVGETEGKMGEMGVFVLVKGDEWVSTGEGSVGDTVMVGVVAVFTFMRLACENGDTALDCNSTSFGGKGRSGLQFADCLDCLGVDPDPGSSLIPAGMSIAFVAPLRTYPFLPVSLSSADLRGPGKTPATPLVRFNLRFLCRT